ncbi:MAG: hypothetical protein JXB62_21365 [Pirellulales bacterium]|nr:hypothetical protein [Pirellulales bacterium]
MRTLGVWSGALSVILAAGAVGVQHWDFEDAAAGKLPSGWKAATTGEGAGSVWSVETDAAAPAGPKVLAQTSSEGPRPLFNLCIAEETSYRDLDLRVAMKAVRGKIDQGGGPVWRLRDKDNYYIARMNPLENNYRVYKVVDGKRTQLASADVEAKDDAGKPAPLTGAWHTIRIVQRGDRIRCYLHGKLLLEASDATFREAGKVGLWTKADAVTSFDGLSVKDLTQ